MSYKTVPATSASSTEVHYLLSEDSLKVTWDQTTSVVTFEVTVPTNTYFGLGFGPTMTNTDMILWQNYGDASLVTDLWSNTNVTP